MSAALALEPNAEIPPRPAPVATPPVGPAPAPAAASAAIPAWRVALYGAASVFLGVTQGLGINLVTANLAGIQGSLGVTQIESNWLIAAYMATNLAGTILLYKVRTEFGLRRFAELGLLVYVLVTAAHLLADDLRSAVVVRAAMGVAAAPLSTLAFFYMLEVMKPEKKLTVGICFGLLGGQIAVPLARVISPDLLELGRWHGLYLLETGLALISLAIVFLLPISHPPRQKVFDRLDLLSFPLLAIGSGAFAVLLTLGRLYWWFDTPWLGVLAVVGILALTAVLILESQRAHPMIDLKWLSSSEMLIFAGSLLVFRLLLAEQTTGVVGLFTSLGLLNDQLATLYWIILGATVGGLAVTSLLMGAGRTPAIHLTALTLIASAAFLDSHATNLSRPEQFYLTQAMMAFAGAMFLPPALQVGFGQALARGGNAIVSFLVVFIGTQTLGGLIGSAALGTFVTLREKFHSSALVEHLTAVNPFVAQRIQAYAGAYGKVLSDPALRTAEGAVLLGRAATQEATVLAYNDLFLLIAVLAVGAMLVLISHQFVIAWRAASSAAARV